MESVFCLMCQNEDTAECGAGSDALHSAGRSSDRPEHCLHLNVNVTYNFVHF